MGQLRLFVPIFHCQVLWKFSTMSICALPLSGFVDFQIRDLWISAARICEFLQRGFVGRFISCGGAGWCHTQPLLYRWISMSICHEYLPWIFVNKQHLTTEYTWIFAMNICKQGALASSVICLQVIIDNWIVLEVQTNIHPCTYSLFTGFYLLTDRS